MAQNQVLFGGKTLNLLGNTIKVGDKAPDFTVVDNGLGHKKLSDYAGKVRILSIYPSIDTPVCATQNRTFNKEAANVGDVVIMGISNDLPFAQKRFCAAEGIDKVVTMSDYQQNDFGNKYGFLIEGVKLLSRGTVVVDKDDVVQYVEYVAEIGKEPNYEAALAVAKKLV